ncbi:protein FAR1-RELATED SEQUENCE 7-like [Humulus lupulus]|uniref:protein FAR1-RELATED SEQUENCE 7-like n=1 Tax=Humulus lupulus TaxID=3486 RepID=UPI002B410E62|nr:protein FAR1-RELATED SEQUENCE 7-like [Humulus lupulus]
MDDVGSFQETSNWENILQSLGIEKLANDIEMEDVEGKVLESLEEWEDFYYTYSLWVGFCVRKADVREKIGNINMRKWVCSKESFHKDTEIEKLGESKRKTSITRAGFQASFRVVMMGDDGLWICKEFQPLHNHDKATLDEL